jgi:hypothetical protein
MSTNFHNQPESAQLTIAEHAILGKGREALTALIKNFDLWIEIGHALKVLRDKANDIGGNERVISKIFARLRDQNGFGGLIRQTVSKLIIIVEHEAEVREWHQKLTPKQQREWAAPTTIMKHCPVFKKETPKPTDKKPNDVATLKREVAQLTAERDQYKTDYERASDPAFDEVVEQLVKSMKDKSEAEVDRILADIKEEIMNYAENHDVDEDDDGVLPEDDGLTLPDNLKVENRKPLTPQEEEKEQFVAALMGIKQPVDAVSVKARQKKPRKLVKARQTKPRKKKVA